MSGRPREIQRRRMAFETSCGMWSKPLPTTPTLGLAMELAHGATSSRDFPSAWCTGCAGTIGFKEGTSAANTIGALGGVFIILLGCWGISASLLFEARARRHRDRVDSIRAKLEPGFKPGEKTRQMIWVWVLFHLLVVAVGIVVLAKLR